MTLTRPIGADLSAGAVTPSSMPGVDVVYLHGLIQEGLTGVLVEIYSNRLAAYQLVSSVENKLKNPLERSRLFSYKSNVETLLHPPNLYFRDDQRPLFL